MKSKAIIFDIDGTIVDSPVQKLPSGKMVKAFKAASSTYYLSPATGRPWPFARAIIEALNITDPCIVAAGTQIRSAKGDVLWQCNIPEIALNEILLVLKSEVNLSFVCNDFTEDDYLQDKGNDAADFAANAPIHFLDVIFVPDTEAIRLREQLTKIKGITCTMVTAQRLGTKDLHITNEFATKEHAIAELLKIIQVDVDKTIGIGDGHNDLHLFAGVLLKVAVGNAVKELKAAADTTIGTVQNDGVADFLNELSGV